MAQKLAVGKLSLMSQLKEPKEEISEEVITTAEVVAVTEGMITGRIFKTSKL
jgi:hypothetical protein